jgi:hypothetical protein
MTLKKDEGSIILYDQLAKQFTNIKIVLYHKNKKLLKQLFERISRKELFSPDTPLLFVLCHHANKLNYIIP